MVVIASIFVIGLILFKLHTGNINENRSKAYSSLSSKYKSQSASLLLKRNELNIKEALIDLELHFKKEQSELEQTPDFFYKNKFCFTIMMQILIFPNNTIVNEIIKNHLSNKQNLNSDNLPPQEERNKREKTKNKKKPKKKDESWLPFN